MKRLALDSKGLSFLLTAVLVLSTILGPLLIASGASAVSQCDINDTITNTSYYNSCTQPACLGDAISTLSGSDDSQKAFNYFVSKGLAPFQSAGIIGNMQAESGVQPERLQSTPSGVQTPAESLTQYQLTHTGNGSVGWGIVQWTPPGKMITPTQQAGKNPNDIGVQLDFLWDQLTTGTEKGAGNALKGTTNVDDAAVSFLTQYERPLDPSKSVNIRVTFAEQILKQYGNGAPASAQTVSSTSTITSACSNTSPADSSHYKNPLRDIKDLKPQRMDQGVDYNGIGPVYALGGGTVVDANANSGWPGNGNKTGGTFISYQLTEGPASGKFVYFAEDCTPVVSVGEVVNSNTVICNMYNGPTAIETGWAQPGSSERTMAFDEYSGHEGLATSFGQNFSKLMQSLGAPAGTVDAGISTTPLPAGWPAW